MLYLRATLWKQQYVLAASYEIIKTYRIISLVLINRYGLTYKNSQGGVTHPQLAAKSHHSQSPIPITHRRTTYVATKSWLAQNEEYQGKRATICVWISGRRIAPESTVVRTCSNQHLVIFRFLVTRSLCSVAGLRRAVNYQKFLSDFRQININHKPAITETVKGVQE